VRTRVGYAGGTSTAPTYRSMDDHTETIEIDYDPTKVSYELLLQIFWRDHDPTGRPSGRQYRSLILVHDEAQRRSAEAGKSRYAEKTGRAVHTAIEDYTGFTRAEDYHQKYRLRRWKGVSAELAAIYPNRRAFTDSTAVARLNGYLALRGDRALFRRELPHLGLSPSTQIKVSERVLGDR
jgi:peptide-methionine (S)-S-oxide reductase